MSERVRMTAGELAEMLKSEETPRVSTEHHPLGTHGLWRTPSKKVPETQQLPAYVQNVARALMRDHGMSESQAIATAVNAIKRWASGKLGWGRRKITPEVQAAARRALAEWEALRASHKCLSCGCHLPDIDHDDHRHITVSDLMAAGSAAGISAAEAADNIAETMEQMVGDGAANWPQ